MRRGKSKRERENGKKRREDERGKRFPYELAKGRACMIMGNEIEL
jgi:hypothetical protein